MITNRGIKVWPEGFEETFCTDHWRCRFKPTEGNGRKTHKRVPSSACFDFVCDC